MPVLTEAMSLNIQLSGICGMTFFESRNRGFESNCVNNHFWTECIYFLKPCETLRVVHETQTLWIGIENSRFVIKTQEVDKE